MAALDIVTSLLEVAGRGWGTECSRPILRCDKSEVDSPYCTICEP